MIPKPIPKLSVASFGTLSMPPSTSWGLQHLCCGFSLLLGYRRGGLLGPPTPFLPASIAFPLPIHCPSPRHRRLHLHPVPSTPHSLCSALSVPVPLSPPLSPSPTAPVRSLHPSLPMPSPLLPLRTVAPLQFHAPSSAMCRILPGVSGPGWSEKRRADVVMTSW